MTNEQLVMAIKSGQDTARNMEQLYRQVRAFIYSIARRYRDYAELEDLEQEGYLALYDAIDGYDPAAGCLFLTYAKYWIRQRIVRYVQNGGVVRLPVHERGKLNQYKKLQNAFLSQIGRKPTEREVRYYLGYSSEQIRKLERASRMENIGSLDGYVNGDEDITLGDLVPGTEDVESAVLDEVEREELQAAIWMLVDGLNDQQSKVIRAKYQQGMTQQQIGADMGVKGQRVSAIEREAMRELRKKGYRLRTFLPEAVGSRAYHGSREAFRSTWTSSTERIAMELEQRATSHGE